MSGATNLIAKQLSCPRDAMVFRSLATCLEDAPFLFLETACDETQDLLEHVVRDFCAKKHAVFADTLPGTHRLLSGSAQTPEAVHVLYIRDWQRFTGAEIMAHVNGVFEAELRRQGPDAWCPPSQRHQTMTFPGTADTAQAFKNLKLVFSGTAEPMEDRGLRSRLEPYRVIV
jgi:hypothetical protein